MQRDHNDCESSADYSLFQTSLTPFTPPRYSTPSMITSKFQGIGHSPSYLILTLQAPILLISVEPPRPHYRILAIRPTVTLLQDSLNPGYSRRQAHNY
jgi:hypothetical protein